MKSKMKSKTKKLLVLSVMVVLLVATGVLNFVLNDKLTSATDNVGNNVDNTVTQTFFAAARSDRDATRESEFLWLDAIVKSDSSSASAKTEAEQQKMLLIKRMEQELNLETTIKGKGFEEAIVTIGDGGISVVVGKAELTKAEANQVLATVVTEMNCDPNNVKVIPYV
ncbi:MAG: SpoIIIAH-like family protein [Bacteroides sp.]|nr:SpoIIIAH-like family protein [Bacillota bacterium]MCM1394288.1 SpoIIIAH-like family protein [[Eubacterium] siraeum]MCM1456016.1 SpoIIIAH-like family protein [Bacteroides sp.]